MTERTAQENTVRLLVIEGSREFNRAFEDLRVWGYAVTAARDLAAFAAAEPPAFDLVCVEIGPASAAPLPEAIRKALPGPGVLGVTALEGEALDSFLSGQQAARRQFEAILQPPLALDRLIFAVEEALARRDRPERVETDQQRRQSLALRRRTLEAERLSAFLARNAEHNFFLNFQPVKSLKEKRI
ncbi:MAG: hypothetical protein Q7R35_15935 [Elusimicrobiota bacterium]|nr:hypothetical protein [Elusimicrobiota bacterium]